MSEQLRAAIRIGQRWKCFWTPTLFPKTKNQQGCTMHMGLEKEVFLWTTLLNTHPISEDQKSTGLHMNFQKRYFMNFCIYHSPYFQRQETQQQLQGQQLFSASLSLAVHYKVIKLHEKSYLELHSRGVRDKIFPSTCLSRFLGSLNWVPWLLSVLT